MKKNKYISFLLKRWPFVIFLGLAMLFALLIFFSRKAPVISSMTPAVVSEGQNVVLEGNYFGRSFREGILTIAGIVPPPSAIISWSDNKIEFRVPADTASGLLTVSNSQGTSEGILLTNKGQLPTVLLDQGAGGLPFLAAYAPGSVSGSLELWGDNFRDVGPTRFVSLIPFSGIPLRIEKVLNWTNRRVLINRPCGYGPQTSVEIFTEAGKTDKVTLNMPQYVILSQPRIYELTLQVDIPVDSGTGKLNLWLNLPDTESSGQPQDNWVFDPPLKTPVRWNLVNYIYNNPAPGLLTLQYKAKITAYFKTLNSEPAEQLAADKVVDDSGIGVPKSWTLGQSVWTSLLQASGVANSGTLGNARKLYDFVTKHFHVNPDITGVADLKRTPQEVWDSKEATDWELTAVYWKLLQTAGVNARPIAGLLISGQRGIPHVWINIATPDVGWVETDPALGADYKPEGYQVPLPLAFGCVDNQHLFWSDTNATVPRNDAGARQVQSLLPYSFQSSLGEITSDLAISKPIWHDGSVELIK